MKKLILFLFVLEFTVDNAKSQTFPNNYDEQQDRKVYIKVDTPASFSKIETGWNQYLAKNQNTEIPKVKHAPSGTYKVIVSFNVNKDSLISNVHAETKFGFGMEKEGIHLIKKSGKWIPAKLNGQNVNSFTKQEIVFAVK